MSAFIASERLVGLSVLVVEDDSIIYYLVEDMLAALGCGAVWRAADVETALSLLHDRRPDIAILDVNLTGKVSYPVAVQLDNLDIPIVFSTGYGRLGIPELWRSRAVIEKPFTLKQFATALDTALGTPQAT